MAGVKLAYEISKDAMKLVKAGKAVVSSGGVRMLDGTLVELAKPVAQSVSGGPLGPLTFVSSLANNVQSVFIQKGVNKANRSLKVLKKQGVQILNELDLVHADTLEIKRGMVAVMDELQDVSSNVDLLHMKTDYNLIQMNQLQNMVSSLGAVTWLNCAFSILNAGISIVGFSQVLGELSKVSGQIAALDQRVQRNLLNDYRQQFKENYDQIRTDMQFLQNPELKISEKHYIPEHLNKTGAFLDRINTEFLEGNIDNELACNILFGLTNAFAQEVQFYSVRYMYEKGTLPAAYDSWVKTIAAIGQRDFQTKLETALSLEYMDMPLRQQKELLDASVLTSRLQLDNMVFASLLTDVIPEEDYLNFDEYLKVRASSEENFIETDDKVLLMIA